MVWELLFALLGSIIWEVSFYQDFDNQFKNLHTLDYNFAQSLRDIM